MTSNRNFLGKFVSKKGMTSLGSFRRKRNLNNDSNVKNDVINCILCNEKIDYQYKNCVNCRGPITRITAKKLKILWNVECSHQLYSRDGDWYHVLDYFPGALFDTNGFVIFETEEEFNRCPHISINREASNGKGIVNVIGNYPQNIRKINGYEYMAFKNGEWIVKEGI